MVEVTAKPHTGCNLVTGQNPASSEATAKALAGLLAGAPVGPNGAVGPAKAEEKGGK